MSLQKQTMLQARRDFFTSSASGLGSIALLSMLSEDGLLAADDANPLHPRSPPWLPRWRDDPIQPLAPELYLLFALYDSWSRCFLFRRSNF